jgi:hypothetical protein
MKHVFLTRIFYALTVTALTALSVSARQYSDLWGIDGERWQANGRMPDFSFAGYHRGEKSIPAMPQTASVKDFGAKGDGNTDDTQAFKAAIAATVSGAISIPEGRYKLTDFIYLRKSGIVLRGAGPDKTILWFPKSLNEVSPKESHTSDGALTTAYSFDFAYLTLEGDLGSKLLSVISSEAKRGDTVIQLTTASGIKPGQSIQIRVQEDAGQTLKKFLYANDPGDIAKGKDLDTKMVVKVTKVQGSQISIDRPLRFDTRKAWKPEVLSFEPTVTESGIEDLALEFPDVPYPGHFKELGFNGIELRTVANCWVRNVHMQNADMGVLFINNACFNTVDSITLNAYAGRGALGGHHAFQAKLSQDNVITHFDIQTTFVHDLSVENASGTVYADGKGKDLCFDHHKDTPYENVYTNLDGGAGTRIWASGGGSSFGRNSAAWETFWNIRAAKKFALPSAGYGPELINLVALNTAAISVKDSAGIWIESIIPEEIFPENIWRAQLQKRLRELGVGLRPDRNPRKIMGESWVRRKNSLGIYSISSRVGSGLNLVWSDLLGKNFSLGRGY